MSTLLLERPPAVAHDFERDRRRLRDWPDSACGPERAGAYDRLTLDDLVTGVWEGLVVRATVPCPVCAGPMSSAAMTSAADEIGAEAPTGACLSCGSRLS
jgi:hypothetical protein